MVEPPVSSSHIRALVGALLTTLACAAMAFSLAGSLGLSPADFYRDPVSVAEISFAAGWFSNLGMIGWIAAAVACLLASSLADLQMRRALAVLGSLTAMLGIDDLFLLHEDILPRIGVKSVVLYAFYGGMALWWAVRYRKLLRATPWPVFAIAVGALGCSTMLDQFADFFRHDRPAFRGMEQMLGIDPALFIAFVKQHSVTLAVAEDSFKLFGILAWAIYCIVFARYSLSGRMAGGTPRA